MSKKGFLLTLSFLCFLSLAAQEGSFLSYADSLLQEHYRRINYDTSYIVRPKHRWTLKARPKLSFFNMRSETRGDKGLMEVDLMSELKGKVSFSIGYSGITLSASAKPERLLRKEEQDYKLRFDVFTRKFGFETELSQINSLEGTFHMESPLLLQVPEVNDTVLDFSISSGFASQYNFLFSGYYVFNHRRFSYPAAFTQSYIQKRNAGSIIAGAYISLSQLTLGDSTNNTELYRVINAFVSLGVGYGYNFVLQHNWLLHISTIPYFIIYDKAICRFGGKDEEWETQFPQVVIVARAAIIHSWERWFAGMTTHYTYSHVGTSNLISIDNQQWHFMAIVGFRL